MHCLYSCRVRSTGEAAIGADMGGSLPTYFLSQTQTP